MIAPEALNCRSLTRGVVQDLVARSRTEIEQARLPVLETARLIDAHGAKGARTEIAAIQGAAPAVATAVIDRAIEVFGGAGVSNDFPFAYFYAWARVLRIVDGPDAVHRHSAAREEAKRAARCTVAVWRYLAFMPQSAVTRWRFRSCPVVPVGDQAAGIAPRRRREDGSQAGSKQWPT